jgi:serine/threonine protein kinase/Tol biopolymer transport system component
MTDTPDLAGRRVGRYDVISLLGRGGMGSVYDAVDSTLGRHVALKILPPAVASDAKRLARFVQEARAASALNHPNVVAIYEIGHEQVDSNDVHFIAMEMVEGRNLRAVVSGARLPIPQAVELVAQIADAIGAAHSAGIVHRDLKPENVVMSALGAPKVLDFGLAKLRPDAGSEESGSPDDRTALRSTDSGVILGTVGYMSPEQAQGKPADHRSDIFSLGCILYEAIAGHRAFAAASSVETLSAIIKTDPLPLRESSPSAPAELQRIVSKAMAKKPDERYQSAKDLAIDLRALLRELAAAATPQRHRAPGRRGTTAILVAAAIMVLAAIALFVRSRSASAPSESPARSLNVRRVTARGNVIHAAISPDGRFVAYSLLNGTIRLRQLATEQELELVRLEGSRVWGVTFTRDGNSVVYLTKDPQKPVGSLFRIPSIGGRPEHLFDGIDCRPAFSPDGKQVTFVRAEFPSPGESALMVANIDGSAARAISIRRAPERFAPMFFTGPSWSPDGKWIASAVQRDADPQTCKLILVDAKSGEEKVLLDRSWPFITQSEWLPDGSGIVTVASSESNDLAGLQLWLVSYPGGTATRITSELSAYRGVSLTKDRLVSIVIENTAQIWSVPLNGRGTAKKISAGRYDGWRGLAMATDGRLVFASIEDRVQTLMISNRDGSERARLTRDDLSNQYPAAFSGGIAYVSSTPTGNEVRVIGLNGENRRVVAQRVDASPIAVSPDSESLVFRRNRRLWKMPIAGGEATQLLTDVSSSGSWSPESDRIAILLGDPDEYSARLAVISAADGRLLWEAPLSSVRVGSTIHWLPDSSGLLVNGGPEDNHNLWLYPFAGKPRRVSDFDDQTLFFWDLSPDGQEAVVARATLSRDAVLISGFR